MASRGSLGGLSPKSFEAVVALDAAGYDYIFVETVGVGQAEVEIVRLADTVLLVLVPGMGDSIQAFKAGIVEIADVFVINKSDYPGADKLKKDLLGLLSLSHAAWKPPIIESEAVSGKGVEPLTEAIEAHLKWAQSSGETASRRKQRAEEAFLRELSEQAGAKTLLRLRNDGGLSSILEEIHTGKVPPSSAARKVMDSY
jgi:LAO/AO transport system kinase